MYESFNVTIQGVAPLIMHNGRLNNPLDPISQAIKKLTSKGKKKTQDDLEQMALLEWEGGLYLDRDGRPIVPGECLEGMIRDGARKKRLGKDVQAGVMCDGVFHVQFDGPKTADGLRGCESFRDTRRAGVNASGVMRTRPIFHAWRVTFTVSFLPDVIDRENVIDAIRIGGRLCGLCDFRPRFGRFEIVAIDGKGA